MNSKPLGIKEAWLKPLLYALPFSVVSIVALGTRHGLFATLMIWFAVVTAIHWPRSGTDSP